MEKYIDEGITYNVAPNRLEEFLQKHPNATKVEEAGKVNGSAEATPTGEPVAMELGLDDGSLELPKPEDVAKAFFHLATSKKTTGAVLTVDGGNIAASLR